MKPLATLKRDELIKALRGNVKGEVILTNRRDTGFIGVAEQLPEDEAVVQAIKSVPCHY